MKDWADGMLLAGVVFLISLLSLTVVHTAVGWLRTVKKPLQQIRDAAIGQDQYREERLARLLQYQPPKGPKGFDAQGKRRAQLQAIAKGRQ